MNEDYTPPPASAAIRRGHSMPFDTGGWLLIPPNGTAAFHAASGYIRSEALREAFKAEPATGVWIAVNMVTGRTHRLRAELGGLIVTEVGA